MVNATMIYKQISDITAEIIGLGICDNQNFPSMYTSSEGYEIVGIKGFNSIALKNILYSELYKILLQEKQYNLKMIDGALIGLQYRFAKDKLLNHRLTFFPAPNLEEFQNDPEIYMNDTLYNDIVDKKIVKTPLRFDFDSGDAFLSVKHPMSHFTIGQYESCRIPVTSALTPYQFLDFIIRNFYNKYGVSEISLLKRKKLSFIGTITDEEEKIMHICVP